MSIVVTRNEWGARAPKTPLARITGVRGVGLHWEGPEMGWFEHHTCHARVRAIQNFHMDSRRWVDVAYNALVCYHGYIFQGRWIGTRSAANGTNEANGSYYAICGLFGQNDPFTDEMKQAYWDCINIFREHGGAGQDIKTHREFKATMCAGPGVQDWKDSGLPLPGPPTPVPQPPPPPPPPTGDWTEEIIMALPTIDFRNANNTPVRDSHLVDNIQGLLKGVQRADCDPGLVDNIGGGKTYQAVVSFQRVAGLDADGIVGPNTWRKLINW